MKYIALIGLSHCSFSTQPRLIVQIVIDQLRGDLIQQHQAQFNQSGFNYLKNHSLDFHNAHHPHANTTTCVGHATIATGTLPSFHGVIDNEWYDKLSGKLVYCMEDIKSPILPTNHTVQKIEGRSPKHLKSTTLSDQIILAKKGKAFAVSFKDRAAITLAGHAGKAFWFDKTNGGFITSQFYYATYPQWVTRWNLNYQPKEYLWTLKNPQSSYQNAHSPKEMHPDVHFGNRFPYRLSHPPSEDYFKNLSKTPKADELTADFAIHLLKEEALGLSQSNTDYLAISFSAVDAIGHQFGPDSLEAEDNLLRLDTTLAKLLQSIDKHVGLANTLIILTADHGVSSNPTYLSMNHINVEKPINQNELTQFIHHQLEKHYQLPKNALLSIQLPFIYLNHTLIEKHHHQILDVQQFLAEHLSTQAGIFRAYALPMSPLMKDWLGTKVSAMFFPQRSGDIYLVPPPNQEQERYVSHGSPWEYDSYVPLLFSHPLFKYQHISRRVYTTDIAPTLAQMMFINSPAASVGTPLQEVLTAFEKINPRWKNE